MDTFSSSRRNAATSACLRLEVLAPDPGRRVDASVLLRVALELVVIDAVVLGRAARPTPTELGTLDAIHLATALLWKEMTHVDSLLSDHAFGQTCS
ncbi:MAG: hypothetical protein HY017_26235 [Betaproteobacteria bacterium]|nr:hypothetical protein [Betaproteobacteria bacterium]